MTYLSQLFKNYFQQLDLEALSYDLITKGVQIVLIFIGLWVIRKFLEFLIKSYFDRNHRFSFKHVGRQETIKKLLLNILQYSYYFLLGYNILAILGVPVSTLVASAGVISLAIGLGAQDLVSDIVNGFFILLEHQYDVGDHVIIKGYSGVVTTIGIRTTTIRDYNGYHHFIPNGNIQDLTNMSRDAARINVDLLVDPAYDFNRYEKILQVAFAEEAEGDDMIRPEGEFKGLFKDKWGRVIYRVRIWVLDVDDVVDVEGRYTQAFSKALEEAGLSIPASENYRIQAAVRVEGQKGRGFSSDEPLA